LGGAFFFVLRQYFMRWIPFLANNFQKYLQMVITFNSQNKNASVWAFWKGISE
jgi:hypothetical protein